MLITRQIYYFIKLTINTYFTRNLYYSICNDECCNNFEKGVEEIVKNGG